MERHIPVYGVFIIESMDWENEQQGKLDGYALKQILDLSDIKNSYIYIRTRQEFEYAMDLFRDTDFGFLHIACHGNETGICLTIDDISFEDLELIMGPYMKYRRLFLSACKVACFSFAEYFIPQHHCYSIIGSADTIDYDKAAIFWSAYYYLMFNTNDRQMWQQNILKTLTDITRTFGETLNYFSIINEKHQQAKTALRAIQFKDGQISSDEVKETRFDNRYWQEAIATISGPGNGPQPTSVS